MFKDAHCMCDLSRGFGNLLSSPYLNYKCFAGQVHCFSDCVVDNTVFKTKYSVVMHIFNSGKHNIF